MSTSKMVGKREFIQHTSKYLKWVEDNESLVITHRNEPDLVITKIKQKSFEDMRGFTKIKIHGDINDHVLPGYNEW
jgi:prevent-host-death family protein